MAQMIGIVGREVSDDARSGVSEIEPPTAGESDLPTVEIMDADASVPAPAITHNPLIIAAIEAPIWAKRQAPRALGVLHVIRGVPIHADPVNRFP